MNKSNNGNNINASSVKSMTQLVREGYEQGDYSKYANRDIPDTELVWINFFSKLMRAEGEIADFGCSNAKPYDIHLANLGYNITGVDLSEKHINEAKVNLPNGNFTSADYTVHDFGQQFDGIVSFYSIFNVPREKHADLFKKMYNDLKPDSPILITLGMANERMAITDFIGSQMAWSSYDNFTNKELFEDAGFEIKFEYINKRGTNHHQWLLGYKN